MENDNGSNNSEKLPSEVEDLLKKVSREIVDKQNGYCFTIDNPESDSTIESYSAYNSNELSEFVNFNVLGEEDDNIEHFPGIVTKENYQDLLGDGRVKKILLDPGEYNGKQHCSIKHINISSKCPYS